HYGEHLISTCSGRLDEESQAKLGSLLRLTRRMDALIDSLLNYARVGRVELEMHEVDLNETLAEALDILTPTRRETNIQIRVPRALPTVRCDSVCVREL